MTRKVLRLLGSRYGIAAILLVLVVIAVSVARANTDPDPGTSQGSDSTEQIDEGAPNDGYVEPSDEEEDDAESALPSEALEVAGDFSTEWVKVDREQEEWYEAVSQYATENLQEQLAETEPSRVPATETRDAPVASDHNAEINTDAGLLILRMTKEDGNWLVDGIDFDNP